MAGKTFLYYRPKTVLNSKRFTSLRPKPPKSCLVEKDQQYPFWEIPGKLFLSFPAACWYSTQLLFPDAGEPIHQEVYPRSGIASFLQREFFYANHHEWHPGEN